MAKRTLAGLLAAFLIMNMQVSSAADQPTPRARHEPPAVSTNATPEPALVARVEQAIQDLDSLIQREPPEGVSPADREAWDHQTSQLEDLREQLSTEPSAGTLGVSSRSAERAPAVAVGAPPTNLKQLESSFPQRQLSTSQTQESRQYSLISNAMKARGDAAQAVISNLR
jgi:hypothetical protein